MKRRDFISHSSAIAAGALILPNSLFSFGYSTKSKVRIGFIAVGYRGQTHISEMLKRNDVEIIAIADPDERMIESAQLLIEKETGSRVDVYQKGDYDYKNMLSRNDIDAVFVSSL